MASPITDGITFNISQSHNVSDDSIPAGFLHTSLYTPFFTLLTLLMTTVKKGILAVIKIHKYNNTNYSLGLHDNNVPDRNQDK